MLPFRIVVIYLFLKISANAYYVTITKNTPVVLGATVQFQADLFDDDGSRPGGKYRFKWMDNAMPAHEAEFEEHSVSTWNVTYSRIMNGPGVYEVQVTVARQVLFYYNIASCREYFNITALLNGNMDLIQSSASVDGQYVSSGAELTHAIKLNEADAALVNSTATSVITYWFIDCIYYGITFDEMFKFNYTDAVDKDVSVDALVIASYDPITTPAPLTTTTVSPNTSTTTTTAVPPWNYLQLMPIGMNHSEHPVLPFICSSLVLPDPAKTYGVFNRQLKVKAPVTNIVVSGARWLHDGELLNLGVSCNGSSPYSYCIKIVAGEYNVTGNETCLKERIITECQVNVSHYFRTTNTSTVIIIIKNEVTKKVASAVINIYEVTKQPQLSVIIVPVSCSALAVILIVFGAAYYIQSRNRYPVEVADFDFAQASDMEYMTFRERLIDSINRALNRTHEYDEDSGWLHGRKYGSMQ